MATEYYNVVCLLTSPMFAEGPPRVTPGMVHRELAPALLDLFLIVEPRATF